MEDKSEFNEIKIVVVMHLLFGSCPPCSVLPRWFLLSIRVNTEDDPERDPNKVRSPPAGRAGKDWLKWLYLRYSPIKYSIVNTSRQRTKTNTHPAQALGSRGRLCYFWHVFRLEPRTGTRRYTRLSHRHFLYYYNVCHLHV